MRFLRRLLDRADRVLDWLEARLDRALDRHIEMAQIARQRRSVSPDLPRVPLQMVRDSDGAA